MIKKLSIFILLFSFSTKLYAQEIIDTLYTSHGTVLLYENRSWQYLEDIRFDGVMNKRLHDIITEIPELNLSQKWDNDVCFTSGRGANSMNSFNDTIWLCLQKDQHDEFKIPVPGIVTSRYGYRWKRNHNGIDLNLNTGDTVVAAWSGKVRYAKYNNGGYGNLVIIRHDNGLETLYAHLSKTLVAPNQYVKAGDPIALGGNTGHSFGAHLHFEVRFYDLPMNPEEIIDFETRTLRDVNLMVHKNLFRPGAKPSHLMDPSNNVPQVASTISATKATVSSSTNKYYKVRSGDTLSSIAAKNQTSIAKICQLNGIKQTTVLQVGRNLRVR